MISAETLAQTRDLEAATRVFMLAVAREHAIRDGMTETGETREIVTSVLDAAISMEQEAVLDLMEGDPTTLTTGLVRYIEELARQDELLPRDRIIGELNALVTYPWPGA